MVLARDVTIIKFWRIFFFVKFRGFQNIQEALNEYHNDRLWLCGACLRRMFC